MPDQSGRLKAALADRYEIEREVGAGGMATVYLAHDLRHDRRVALKVLRPELAASLGAERFLREIRIAANLTHPHILPVHESGEADGVLYYVMPFIDGESLRTKLDREGELPVATTARILRDVADALAAAHAQGIVHRDIKPDNVLLTGRHALVADFGVAKAVSQAAGQQDLTTMGVALGTPNYMSPEQAAGDSHIDHRADLYAMGAMAYEMIAGRPPFAGTSAQQILSAHLTKTPAPVTDLRANVPAALSTLIMRCLEKKPADRVQTAAELVPLLESLAASTTTLTPAETMAVPAAGKRSGIPLWAVGILGLAGAALIAYVLMTDGSPGANPALKLGQRIQVTREQALEVDPALSPDGNLLAYAAGTGRGDFKVFVRQVDGGAPIAVAPNLEGDQRFPSWSPDGTRLLFRSLRGLEVGPALGGMSKTVAPAVRDRATWSPDGTRVAFVKPGELVVMPAAGGASSALARDTQLHSPAWSPDGQWIAYVVGNETGVETIGNISPSAIWMVPAAGGDPRRLTDTTAFNASPAWLAEGSTLLFVSDRSGGRDVYSQTIAADGTAVGSAQALTTGLNVLAVTVAAKTSRIGYSVFLDRSNVWSMPIPVRGPASSSEARPVTSGNQVVEIFEVSRDGQWLAFDANRAGNQDIYRQPVAGGPVEQLTNDPADDFGPSWSPDGSEIAFYSYRDQKPRRPFVMPSRGGPAAPIRDEEMTGLRWRPDGEALLVRRWPSTLAVIRRNGSTWGAAEPLAEKVLGSFASWSPNGQSIAYSGATELAVINTETRKTTRLVSRAANADQFHPLWSADGRAVYFLDHAKTGIFEVPASGGTPRMIVRFDPVRPWHRYGFQAVGGRFYFTLGEVESDLWVADVAR